MSVSTSTMVMTKASNKGLALWLAVMAGMSQLASASIMFDLLGPKWSGAFLALIGSLNAGTAAWLGFRRPIIEMPAPVSYDPQPSGG